MTKKSILIRKMRRAYNNKSNWEYSKFKGYPKNTYFGYASFDDMKKSVLKEFTQYYGSSLRKCRLPLLTTLKLENQ